MELRIHNVGHGQCISFKHDNGNAIVWDCGHQDGARPSTFLPQLGIRRIDNFVITNFDQDHISDFLNIRTLFHPYTVFHTNRTLTSAQLRAIKSADNATISPEMEAVLTMLHDFDTAVPGTGLINEPQFPGVEFRTYVNRYGSVFRTTNDLSVASVLQVHGVKVVIPGDLEHTGWQGLMQNRQFVTDIVDADILVASHHGRENGYVEKVLRHVNPLMVVFSDSAIQYATQEMTATYARHCRGHTYKGNACNVLTTRKHGTLSWSITL